MNYRRGKFCFNTIISTVSYAPKKFLLTWVINDMTRIFKIDFWNFKKYEQKPSWRSCVYESGSWFIHV